MSNKKFISKENEHKIKDFYSNFYNSKRYVSGMLLIVLIGLLFFPLSPTMDLFPYGPFYAGPYSTLILMFFICTFYKNIILYLYIIVQFLISMFIPTIGVIMGSRYTSELVSYFLPIFIFLIINISTAIFTYKYKDSFK